MNDVRESCVQRRVGRSACRSVRRGVAVLTAAALVVVACGSDDTSSGETGSSVVVAGAQENAVATGGVCYSWPNGTTDAQPCAVGLKGPGGGRVFYDAGSVQPWGRFLEVAPQNWNGTLVQCPGIRGSSCGTTDKNIIPRSTSDGGPGLDGYFICGQEAAALLGGEVGATRNTIGDGRRNTEVLSQSPECTNGSTSAVSLAIGYRGGGLADWHLPSADELVELCKYEGRNDIGGFLDDFYVSSTVRFDSLGNTDFTNYLDVDFSKPTCPVSANWQDCVMCVKDLTYIQYFVRPIRAFS